MKVYIDGKFYDEDKAKISVFDHGLLYGDGIFEGIRAYHGKVFKLKEHIERLYYSAKAILLTIPMTPAQMTKAVLDTCRKNKISDGYIRLVVTRGVGTLGLNPNRCKAPSVIVIVGKIQLYPPELYARGMDIVTVATTRNLHNAVNPAIKSLNYLNNILAKIEANAAGADDALMLDAHGFIAETNATNVFLIMSGAVLTPIADGCLPGITRAKVIAMCRAHGIPVAEQRLTVQQALDADEMFVTGTLGELTPVATLDSKLIGGEGAPARGPLTGRLQRLYGELTASEGTLIPDA